jgi:hypothetical protein
MKGTKIKKKNVGKKSSSAKWKKMRFWLSGSSGTTGPKSLKLLSKLEKIVT